MGLLKRELKDFSTKELCDELARREGVGTVECKPYEPMAIQVDGPAIVFVVID